MPTSVYDIGDLRRLQADFTDVAGAAANPTTTTLTVREPDGVITTKTGGDLSNPSTGRFTYDFTITKAGRHIVRWAGTGAVVTAGETEFYARRKAAQA